MEKVLLTLICRPKQWKTISSKDLLESGYPVYGANGKIGFYNSYTHEHPTVLITCRGATCGSINISDPKSYVNGNAMALDNLSEEVDLYYLKYYLEYRKLDDVISGSAQPQITGKGLSKVKIPLPPLDQQKKIAAILDAADAYRQKTKALIEKYDELTQSLFLDMFGDPVTNPKGWGELEFKDIVIKEKNAIVDGPFGSSIKQIDYVDEGIPIIRINNVRNEGYYDAEYKYLRREKYLELIRSKVQQNDILIARVGNTIGKACVFNKSFEALLSTTGVAKASIDFTRYNLFFIIKMISLPIYKQYIMSFVQGAGQPYLNLSKIKSFKVIDVPFDLQNQFAERVQAIESQKAQAQASLAQAEDLFNSLLQRAFKGELS